MDFCQSNFVGKDEKLVVLDTAWSSSRNQLAVAGSLNEKWAVRVYKMDEQGPELINSWDGNESMHFSSVTKLSWLETSGELVCGVEFIGKNKPMVGLLSLKPSEDEFIFKHVSGLEFLMDLVPDPTNSQNIIILGEGSGGEMFISKF